LSSGFKKSIEDNRDTSWKQKWSKLQREQKSGSDGRQNLGGKRLAPMNRRQPSSEGVDVQGPEGLALRALKPKKFRKGGPGSLSPTRSRPDQIWCDRLRFLLHKLPRHRPGSAYNSGSLKKTTTKQGVPPGSQWANAHVPSTEK